MHVLEIVSMLPVVALPMIVRLPRRHGNCICKYRLSQEGSLTIPTRRRSAPSPRRLQGVGWVGLVPLHVARRPVDGRDRLVPGEAQPGLHLRSMMAGVQDAPPEDPNPLSLQAAEER